MSSLTCCSSVSIDTGQSSGSSEPADSSEAGISRWARDTSISHWPRWPYKLTAKIIKL